MSGFPLSCPLHAEVDTNIARDRHHWFGNVRGDVLALDLKFARHLTLVPRRVMTGFVNALAILIFMAQPPQFVGANRQMYGMVAAGLTIIFLLPRLVKNEASATLVDRIAVHDKPGAIDPARAY